MENLVNKKMSFVMAVAKAKNYARDLGQIQRVYVYNDKAGDFAGHHLVVSSPWDIWDKDKELDFVKEVKPEMINCTVEQDKMGYLTVTFDDKRTIYLQSEWQRAQFGVDCGIIEAPKNWSGVSQHLEDGWEEKDFESITECPDYYINSAE